MSAPLLVYAFAMTVAAATLLLCVLRYRQECAEVTQDRDEAVADARLLSDMLYRAQQRTRVVPLSDLLRQRRSPWGSN